MTNFMTLNYGVIGIPSKGRSKIRGKGDYLVEIGEYDVGGYETDHRWYDKCVRDVKWSKTLNKHNSKLFYDVIMQAIKNTSVRLLKRVHSPIFEIGSDNLNKPFIFIVYSYRSGWATKRAYIKFTPITDVDDVHYQSLLRQSLPKLGSNIPVGGI